MTVTIMKKQKKVKTRVGMFKNMGGNFPWGDFPGGSLLGGSFPDTLFKNNNTCKNKSY